ncbi:DsbA family protein [Rhodoblastus acidophilus]|uniref:DsbA family protein n=1 Tax=Candidatus Rhodoblastus alkanivorans TaxID=2954117 RepID=A0ABS9Z6I1_9HYPH|nr:DsbA family protein [Candidatus Rhodoblastus alkanivorans]MCI4679715.1 DsbA family protein [Candidatus Rhodoblastus alkanivorans]MCI4683223.1 DsbA family protein [Candidatus Rhodoblastus alkanivorans]MDI4640535.1 DsbA family protein [Rhodoblastus acidophilus]
MLTNRRTVLLAALASSPLLASGFVRRAKAQQMTLESIANDPDAPTAGNPKGDVTIVAFLDYNCPYCKKSAPTLDGILQTDSGVRLVYKDCPVLSEASVFGARMALAANYQGAYQRVHAALMRIPGRRNPQSTMEEAIASSGADLARLKSDLIAHGDDIDRLIRRNIAQAEALGFDGVPNFLIGPYKAHGYIDFDAMKSAVAQARALTAAKPEAL